jgi:5-methylcytosine-specific restriction endonuclease McrA
MRNIERKCEWCGKTFLAYPSEIKKGRKFCSQSCSTTYRNTHDKPTKSVEVRDKISKHHADVSGEKNPMYMRRGKEAPSYKDGRNSFKGEIYRRMLLASGRKQECEICKATTDLHVHHIDGDHSHNVLENLTWVCVKCHNSIMHPIVRDEKGRFATKTKLKEVM